MAYPYGSGGWVRGVEDTAGALHVVVRSKEHITLFSVCETRKGSMPEWLKGTYCKFVGIYLRWFKSSSAHLFYFF